MIRLDVSEREREMLAELLEREHRDTMHELHRTDALNYKQLLREKPALIERLRSRMVPTVVAG